MGWLTEAEENLDYVHWQTWSRPPTSAHHVIFRSWSGLALPKRLQPLRLTVTCSPGDGERGSYIAIDRLDHAYGHGPATIFDQGKYRTRPDPTVL